jgi:hypothetical protein
MAKNNKLQSKAKMTTIVLNATPPFFNQSWLNFYPISVYAKPLAS